MEIEVVGLHPVGADEPCHLVEVIARGIRPRELLESITQENPGTPRSEWQAPYDEHFLDANGRDVLDRQDPAKPPSGEDLRVAFFFHYLDVARPLQTATGAVALPDPSPRPQRLSFIEYEAP